MSATNRGSQRHADDFYVTPAWATQVIVPVLGRYVPAHGSILEPGAGTGAITRVLREGFPDSRILCVESDPQRVWQLRQQNFETHWCDFIRWHHILAGRKFDLVAGNPPYKLARPFVERSLLAGRMVAMLLGLSFAGSRKRQAWHKAHRPDIYVLSRRPSFTSDGQTDARDYAWFIWGPETDGRWESLACPGD